MGFGVLALWIAQDYPGGTARRMGPGYFPSLLGYGLCVIGALLLVHGLLRDERAVEAVSARPFLVLVAVVIFALLLQPAGLAAATTALILISAFANREFRLLETLVSAAVLVAFSVAVFIFGLGLPISIFPNW
jgi:hypothetical protein